MSGVSSTNFGTPPQAMLVDGTAPAAVAVKAHAKPAVAPAVQEKANPAAAPVIEQIASVRVDPQRLAQHFSEVAVQLSQQLARNNVSVGFSIDGMTGRPVMTLRSTVSGEILREVPSQAALAVTHSIEQFKGILLSLKA